MPEKPCENEVDEQCRAEEERYRPAAVQPARAVEVEHLRVGERLTALRPARRTPYEVLGTESERERVLSGQARVVEVVRVVAEEDVQAASDIRPVRVGEAPPRCAHRLLPHHDRRCQDGESRSDGRPATHRADASDGHGSRRHRRDSRLDLGKPRRRLVRDIEADPPDLIPKRALHRGILGDAGDDHTKARAAGALDAGFPRTRRRGRVRPAHSRPRTSGPCRRRRRAAGLRLRRFGSPRGSAPAARGADDEGCVDPLLLADELHGRLAHWSQPIASSAAAGALPARDSRPTRGKRRSAPRRARRTSARTRPRLGRGRNTVSRPSLETMRSAVPDVLARALEVVRERPVREVLHLRRSLQPRGPEVEQRAPAVAPEPVDGDDVGECDYRGGGSGCDGEHGPAPEERQRRARKGSRGNQREWSPGGREESQLVGTLCHPDEAVGASHSRSAT